MFTGIITDIGEIIACERTARDTHLRITCRYNMQAIAIGASIACSGICLTVSGKGNDWFAVTASAETAGITTLSGWQVGTRLNLERALKMGDELGGHLVSGHVDGTAVLESVEPAGESYQLTLLAPQHLARYLVRKGSVTLDGISLTINHTSENRFGVTIIPHTWQHTTLFMRKNGDTLNLEIDMIARYIERLHEKR